MIEGVRRESYIEWLWTLDLVDLSRDIPRYRQLKTRILEAHRVAAVEAILTRVDGEGMSVEAMPVVRHHARRATSEWRNDLEPAIESEARLVRGGFDQIGITPRYLFRHASSSPCLIN
jgi:hypothetical protein